VVIYIYSQISSELKIEFCVVAQELKLSLSLSVIFEFSNFLKRIWYFVRTTRNPTVYDPKMDPQILFSEN
jgi:hypothetical protein